MMIKLHNSKTFPGRLGVSEKRWTELKEATKKPLMLAKDTPEAIKMSVEALKKASEVDLIIIGYIVGSWNMKHNIMGGDITTMLLASLLK